MNALAVIPTQPEAPADGLTAEEARAVTAEIRAALSYAQDLLRFAWRGRVWVTLGYPSWQAYVEAEFGDVLHSLALAERQSEVVKWRAIGASTRAIAAAVRASVGSVAADTKAMAPPVSGADVIALDGRRMAALPAARPSGPARPAKALTTRVEEMLLEAGPDGLTSAEAGRRLRVHHGRISATLTRLEQQRRVVRLGDRRGAHGVYRHPMSMTKLTRSSDCYRRAAVRMSTDRSPSSVA